MNTNIIEALKNKVGDNYLLKDNKLFLKEVDGDIVIALGKVAKVEKILFLFTTSPQRKLGYEFLLYLKEKI